MAIEEIQLKSWAQLLQLIDEALHRTKEYRQQLGEFGPLDSSIRQLTAAKDVAIARKILTSQELEGLTLGHIAVRELEELDPQLSDQLKSIDYALRNLNRLEE